MTLVKLNIIKMVMSINFVIKRKLKIYTLFKIVTLVLFVCLYRPNDDNNIFGNVQVKEDKYVIISDAVFHRSLSKHGYKEKGELTNLKDKLSYERDMKREKTGLDAMFTYSSLKKKGLSPLELYKKNYKNRYSKKKGLKKLDCYLEKIIFDRIENVNILAEKTKNRKKRFIKKILNRYTISLFLLALIPYYALILPALFGNKDPKKNFKNVHFGECTNKDASSGNRCKDNFSHVSREYADAMFYISNTIFFVSIIAFISIITYTAVKYIKYEFLKHGLGNITLKEYFRLLKKTF